jgi:hypothetical protein
MRWWRCEGVGVGGLKAVAWLGLLGCALTLAGCATSSTNEAYASAARIGAQRAARAGDGTTAAVQAPAEPSVPTRANSASETRRPLSALLSGLLGTPPHVSRAIDEEALIAHAIAEHEMRNP